MPGLICVASFLSEFYSEQEVLPRVGQAWEWHGSQI